MSLCPRFALQRGVIVPVAVEHFDEFAAPADFMHINFQPLQHWGGNTDDESWLQCLRFLETKIEKDLISISAKPIEKRQAYTPSEVRRFQSRHGPNASAVAELPRQLEPIHLLLIDLDISVATISGADDISAERYGKREKTGKIFDDENHLRSSLDALLRLQGRKLPRLDGSIEVILPDGSRMVVADCVAKLRVESAREP